jgi:hypothetical protein
MSARIGPTAWSHPESWSDDEIIGWEILAELEAAFGPMIYPEPSGPVFHETLTSDALLGRYCDKQNPVK